MSILSGIVCSSLAQICMKQATSYEGKVGLWLLCISSSIVCYLLSFVAYYFALKYYPITKVSPVMTVGVVMLVVLFGFISGELISVKYMAGLACGFFAIYLILS